MMGFPGFDLRPFGGAIPLRRLLGVDAVPRLPIGPRAVKFEAAHLAGSPGFFCRVWQKFLNLWQDFSVARKAGNDS